MMPDFVVVPGRGEQVREVALARIRRGAVLETPEQFIGLVRAAMQEARRRQAWENRRAA